MGASRGHGSDKLHADGPDSSVESSTDRFTKNSQIDDPWRDGNMRGVMARYMMAQIADNKDDLKEDGSIVKSMAQLASQGRRCYTFPASVQVVVTAGLARLSAPTFHCPLSACSVPKSKFDSSGNPTDNGSFNWLKAVVEVVWKAES